jgi:hypothetical protein
MTESTAGLLARGSPPVTAFPESSPVALWLGLAADSCGGSCGLGATPATAMFRTAFPVRSHVRDRRYQALNGPRPTLVNARLLFDCARCGAGYSRARCRFPPPAGRKRECGAELGACGLSVLADCGRHRLCSNAAAAPATVSGEPFSISHWSVGCSGKVEIGC